MHSHTGTVQALLIVSGLTHHILVTLPHSPSPSIQQLSTALQPVENIISALRISPDRRSSMHDQLYIGQNGSLTGGTSTNLFDFAVLCFSAPFAAPESLAREHDVLDSVWMSGGHSPEDSNFSLHTATGAPAPHEMIAQALLLLSALPGTPVWLSTFMLAAATRATKELTPPLLSRLLAATSNVVKRVLLHSCKHQRPIPSGDRTVEPSCRNVAQPASILSPEGCALSGDVAVPSHQQTSSGFQWRCSQHSPSQHRKSNQGRGPEVSVEDLLEAAKATCMRAQTAAQHSSAFAVLQKISAEVAIAYKQQRETCCPAAACQLLFAACPATTGGATSTAEAQKPHAFNSQGIAIVQVLECANAGGTGCKPGGCSQRVVLAARCPVAHPSGASPRGQEVQGSMMIFGEGQVGEWSLTATANAAESWQAEGTGAGHNLGFTVKLCSHSACSRDIHALVLILPDVASVRLGSMVSSDASTGDNRGASPLTKSGDSCWHQWDHAASQPAASPASRDVCQAPESDIYECVHEALATLKALVLQTDRKESGESCLNSGIMHRALSLLTSHIRAPVAAQLLCHTFTGVGEGACCENFVLCNRSGGIEYWQTVHGHSNRQAWNWWVGKVVNIFCVIDER